MFEPGPTAPDHVLLPLPCLPDTHGALHVFSVVASGAQVKSTQPSGAEPALSTLVGSRASEGEEMEAVGLGGG